MNNELDRRLLLGTAGLAGIAALAAGRASAGPLDPPAGAVAPTGKTLDQVEPRRVINDVPLVGGFRTLNEGAWKLTGYSIAGSNAAGPLVTAAGVATNTVTTANFSF